LDTPSYVGFAAGSRLRVPEERLIRKYLSVGEEKEGGWIK
jgi:hypothetical protein